MCRDSHVREHVLRPSIQALTASKGQDIYWSIYRREIFKQFVRIKMHLSQQHHACVRN